MNLRFEPLFDSACRECDRTPCVLVRDPETGSLRGGDLCGQCFFGDRLMANWELWNDQPEATE